MKRLRQCHKVHHMSRDITLIHAVNCMQIDSVLPSINCADYRFVQMQHGLNETRFRN